MPLNFDIDSALASRTSGIVDYIALRAEMAREAALAEERARAAIPVDVHYDNIGEALNAMSPPREDVIVLQDRLNKLHPDQPEIPVTGILDARTVAEFERYVQGASRSDGVDYAESLQTQSKQQSAMQNLFVRMDGDIEQLVAARNQNLFVDNTPQAESEPAISEVSASVPEPEMETAAPPVPPTAPEPTVAAAPEPAVEPPAPPAAPAPLTPAQLGVDKKAYEVAQQGHAGLSQAEKDRLQQNAEKLNAPPGMESIFALLAMVIGRADLLKDSDNLWSGEQKQPVDIVRDASGRIDTMANGEKQQSQGAEVAAQTNAATPAQPEIKVTELPSPSPQELQAAQASPPPPPAPSPPQAEKPADGPPSYSFAEVKEGVSRAATATKEFVTNTYDAARSKLANMLGISEPAAREADDHMRSCNWQKENCLRHAEQGVNYETVALGGLSAPQIGGGVAIGGQAKA